MSDEEAHDAFRMIRWAETKGEAVCPKCGSFATYQLSTTKRWKCGDCKHQFTVTSGTIFASRKLPIRTYLLAIAIFVNGAKGHSALQLSRDLDVQYKTAFVLSHKFREAMATETADATLQGTVEVDGAYFGGHVKPANWKATGSIAARLRTRLASAAWWSLCASAAGSPSPPLFGPRGRPCKPLPPASLPMP